MIERPTGPEQEGRLTRRNVLIGSALGVAAPPIVSATGADADVPRAAPAVGTMLVGGRRVLNCLPESQLMGGQIWGVSAALHEATETDARAARYTNTNLAEYMIAVNSDVPSYRVLMLPDPDTQVNDLGIKGVGELGNVCMNAAVANGGVLRDRHPRP